jgi:hypothetical protein
MKIRIDRMESFRFNGVNEFGCYCVGSGHLVYFPNYNATMKLRWKEQEAFVQGVSRGDFLIIDGYVLLGDLNN